MLMLSFNMERLGIISTCNRKKIDKLGYINSLEYNVNINKDL